MDRIQKNILDLQFQKCLVIASTAVVVAFTYIIGVSIAFLSKQLLVSRSSLTTLLFFSGTVFGPCGFFFYRAVAQIKEIPKILKSLK